MKGAIIAACATLIIAGCIDGPVGTAVACPLSIPTVCSAPDAPIGEYEPICVDLQLDPLNCGQCRAACAPGIACEGGVCQGDGGTSTDGGMCSAGLEACPHGALMSCDGLAPDEGTVSCCNGSADTSVCARPAGILTTDCDPTCISGECAVSPSGVSTCCNTDANLDACSMTVT